MTDNLDAPPAHGIKPSVTPAPRLRDRVAVTMPGGAQVPGTIVGHRFGPSTPWECRLDVDDKLVYVAAHDMEVVGR